jgi:hypothetical protein
MATTTVTGNKNEVTIVHSNPAMPPLATGAGQAVTSSAKNPGQPNGTVHGQVNAGGSIQGPIFHNPAQKVLPVYSRKASSSVRPHCSSNVRTKEVQICQQKFQISCIALRFLRAKARKNKIQSHNANISKVRLNPRCLRNRKERIYGKST